MEKVPQPQCLHHTGHNNKKRRFHKRNRAMYLSSRPGPVVHFTPRGSGINLSLKNFRQCNDTTRFERISFYEGFETKRLLEMTSYDERFQLNIGLNSYNTFVMLFVGSAMYRLRKIYFFPIKWFHYLYLCMYILCCTSLFVCVFDDVNLIEVFTILF